MNPFEMRLQMIKMANDYLEKRYEHDLKIFNMKLENVGGDEIPKRPKQPTTKDIMKLASQYNDFVSDNC